MSDESSPKRKISRRAFASIAAGLITFVPAAGYLLVKASASNTPKADASGPPRYVPCSRVICKPMPPNNYCTFYGIKAPRWTCNDAYIPSHFCCTSCCFGFEACRVPCYF